MATIKDVSYRPSMAPIVEQCPSAMYGIDLSIKQEAGKPADIGNALHEVFSKRISLGIDPTADFLKEVAGSWGVEVGGYSGIGWRAAKIKLHWEKVAFYFTENAKRESHIAYTLPNGLVWQGTPDIYEVFPDYAVVLDLKTGMQELNHEAQLKDYAAIIAANWSGIERVYAIVFNPMQDIYENWVFERDELGAWGKSLIKKIGQADIDYVKGTLCKYCPRWHSCPAIKRELNLLLTDETVLREGQSITTEMIAQWYPAIEVLKKVIEAYDTAKIALVKNFGTIDLGNGYELFVRRYTKDDINGVVAFNFLKEQGIDVDKIVEFMKINKTSIRDIAKLIAKPRDKFNSITAVNTRFLDGIRDAGGMTEKPVEAVTTRPQRDKIASKPMINAN